MIAIWGNKSTSLSRVSLLPEGTSLSHVVRSTSLSQVSFLPEGTNLSLVVKSTSLSLVVKSPLLGTRGGTNT